eukprot:11491634-Alexandrium_andersonii.AAC.1
MGQPANTKPPRGLWPSATAHPLALWGHAPDRLQPTHPEDGSQGGPGPPEPLQVAKKPGQGLGHHRGA